VLVTCIVGVAQAGRVLLAADSCIAITDDDEGTTPDPKVVTVGGWVIGLAGEWSAVAATRGLDPELVSGLPVDALCAALRLAMQGAGVRRRAWDALAGRDGQLWAIDGVSAPLRIDSRSIGRRRNRATISTWAIGSGSHFARGALEALDDAPLTPIQRAEAALAIASHNAPGVRPPWRHVEG
jgi:hypothetical protein